MYGVMYLAGISMLCTVAVLFLHHNRRPRPVPRVLRHVVLRVIGRKLRITDYETPQSPSDSLAESDAATTARHGDNATNDLQESNDVSATKNSDCSGIDSRKSIRDEWIEIARVVDRFFFVIFSVLIVGITSAMMIAMTVKGPRKVEPTYVEPASGSNAHI